MVSRSFSHTHNTTNITILLKARIPILRACDGEHISIYLLCYRFFPVCLLTGALQSNYFAYKDVIVLCVRNMWHNLLQNDVDYNERKFLASFDHLFNLMSLHICVIFFLPWNTKRHLLYNMYWLLFSIHLQ